MAERAYPLTLSLASRYFLVRWVITGAQNDAWLRNMMVDNCGQIYLQQRLWVDIHLPMFGGYVGNNSEEVAALGGFDDKLPAVGVA